MISDTGIAIADGRARVVLKGREGFRRFQLSFTGSSRGLRITHVALDDVVLVANDVGLPPNFVADHVLQHSVLWESGTLIVEGVLPQAGDRMALRPGQPWPQRWLHRVA